MSTLARNITALIIAAFAVVLMLLVTVSATSAAPKTQGTLVDTLDNYPKSLTIATVYLPDVYGDDWGGAYIVCPGTKETDLTQGGVDISEMTFENGAVAEDVNYIVALNTDGSVSAEKLARGKVDLCEGLSEQATGGQAPVFAVQGNQPLQLQRVEGNANTWKLAG